MYSSSHRAYASKIPSVTLRCGQAQESHQRLLLLAVDNILIGCRPSPVLST
jgi:hypothetical protein